jgi:hypothetical protein
VIQRRWFGLVKDTELTLPNSLGIHKLDGVVYVAPTKEVGYCTERTKPNTAYFDG